MTHLATHHVEHLIWCIRRLSRTLTATESDSSQACTLVDEAERNLTKATEMLDTDITCIGCGCNGHTQCITDDGWGCHWLIVDYEKRKGVCSECSQLLSSWQDDKEIQHE